MRVRVGVRVRVRARARLRLRLRLRLRVRSSTCEGVPSLSEWRRSKGDLWQIQRRYSGDTREMCLAAAPCVHEEDAPHHGEERKVRHLARGRDRTRQLVRARG